MPTEHTLTRAIREEVKRMRAAGEPVWGRKLHGSQFQRDLPDWLFCYAGLFVVIETKKAGGTHGVTEGQREEMKAIARAGGMVTVRTTMEGVRAALADVRTRAQALGLYQKLQPEPVDEKKTSRS